MTRLIVTFILVFLTYSKVQAQDMGLTDSNVQQISQMKVSQNFVEHMQNCQPFKEEKTIDIAGVKTNLIYEIIGKADNICKCVFASNSNLVNFQNKCSFDEVNLQEYTDALLYLMDKEINDKEYTNSIHYLTASTILFNEEICQMNFVIDTSSELREKLKSCSLHESISEQSNTETRIKIDGKDGDKCKFLHIITTKAPNLKELFPQGIPESMKNFQPQGNIVEMDCRLSEEEIDEYIKALETATIETSKIEDIEFDKMAAPIQTLNKFAEKGCCKVQLKM